MKDLRTIGVSNKQQQIYITLLECGITSVTELSHLTKINRTTLYQNLKQLHEMGLVSEIVGENKKYFQAVNPQGLKKIIRDRMIELKKAEKSIPMFIEKYKFSKKGIKKSLIKTYKGTASLPGLIEEVAKSKTDIYFLGTIKGLQHTFGFDLMEKMYTGPRRRNLKIDDYLISDWAASTIRRFHEGMFSKIRFLPPDIEPKGCFVVYENKLIVGQLYPKPSAYVIEDKTMVEMFRMAFQSLWEDLEGKYIPPKPIDFP